MKKPEIIKCNLAVCYFTKSAPAIFPGAALIIAACGGIAAGGS